MGDGKQFCNNWSQMNLSDFGVDLLDPNIDIEDFFDWKVLIFERLKNVQSEGNVFKRLEI